MFHYEKTFFYNKSVEDIALIFLNQSDEAILDWINLELTKLSLDDDIVQKIRKALEMVIYNKLSPIVGNISNINKENIAKLKVLSLIYAWSRTGIIYTGSFYSVPSTYTNEFFIDQIYQFFKLDNSKQEWDKFFIVISYILQLENHFNLQQSQKPKLEEEA